MIESIPKQDNIYKSLFEDSPISLWEMDWSAIKDYLDNLRSTGVIDYREYFENNPTAVSECLSLIKIIDVNNATLELYKANNKKKFLNQLNRISTEESINAFRGALIDIAEGKTTFKGENPNLTWEGDEIYTKIKMTIPAGYEQSLKRVFISVTDITEHRNNELELREFREMSRTLVENAQKEAKRKLEESEEKFKTISSVVQDAIIQINNKGIITYWNRAAERIFGYESQEIMGKDLHSVIIPKRYRSAYSKGMKLFQKTGEGAAISKTLELEGLKKDGHEIPVELSLSAVNIKGKWNAIAIVRDITERKKADVKLKQTLSELDQMFNTSLPMYVVDKDFNIIKVNDMYCSLLKKKREDVLGKKCYDVWKGPNCNTPRCSLCCILEGEDEVEYEVDLELDGGYKLSLIARSVPYRSVDGKIAGAIKSLINITDRKKSETGLRESEEKFRTITEQSLMGIGILQDDVFKYVNQQYADIFGYSVDEILNWPEKEYHKLTHPEDLEFTMEQARKKQLGEHDIITRYQFRGVKKTGEIIWLEIMSHTFSYENNPADLITILDITERKKIEEELKTSEKRFRTIAENFPNGVIVLYDHDLRYLLAEGEVIEKVGLTSEKMVGNNLRDLVTDEYYNALAPHYKAALNGETHRFEFEFRGIIFDTSTLPIKDSDGNIIAGMSISQDITERKKADKALRESEYKYRSLFDNMLEGCALCKIISDENNKPVDFLYLDVNDAFERLTGLKKKDTIGHRVTELIPDIKNSEPNLFKIYGKVALTGEKTKIEFFFEPLKIWLSISVYSPEKGYFVAVFDNITERKKAEEKILKERNKAQSYLDLAGVLIIALNKEGNITQINKKGYEVLGYSEEELIGKQWFKTCLPPRFREPVFKEFKRLIGGELEPIEFYENPILTKSGEERIIAWHNSLLDDKEGNIIGTLTSGEDITERKRSEQKFRNIAEQSLMGLMIIEHGKIRYINEAASKIYGYSTEEMLNWKKFRYLNCVHPDDIKILMKKEWDYFQTDSSKGKTISILRLISKTGKIKWIELYTKFFKYEGKEAEFHTINDISQRIQIEQKLKESEQRLRSFMDSSTDGFILFDSKLNYIDVNRVTAKILGLDKEDLIGKNMLDIAPYLKETGRYDKYMDVIKTGKPFSTEDVIFHIDDRNLDLYLSVRAFKVGENLGLIFTDISERKKAEKEFRINSEIMSNLAEGIYLVRISDLKIMWANSRFEEMFGYNPGEMIEKQVAIVNYQIDKTPEETAAEIVGVLKKTGEWHGEVNNIKKDGTSFWCYANVSVFDHPDYGEVLVAVHTDITERKKAEQELRLQSVIITNLSEGVHLIRMDDGIIVYTNPRFEEMFGYDPGELIGKHISIVNAPTDKNPEETAKEIMEILEESGEWHGEVNNIKKDGTSFWCYANVSAFDHPEYGKVTVAIHTDITERKNADQKLKESEEKYRTLFESSKDGIAMVDLEGNIIDCNQSIIDMTGYTRVETINLTYRQYTPKKWYKMEDDIMNNQVLVRGFSDEYEKECIRKDGTIFPVSTRVMLRRGPYGKPVGYWAFMKDITEHKKIDEEIADLAKFPSENPNPVLRVTPEFVIYVNQSGQDLFKTNIGERIPYLLRELINEAFKENARKNLELRLNNRVYSFFITPIKETGYINIYGSDITERKKAEKEIIDLAKFPSENPNPVFRVDEKNIIYTNQAGQDIFKISGGDKVPEFLREIVNEAFKEKTNKNLELRLNNRDYSFFIIPIKETGYTNIYGRDITTRKETEKELKESEENYRIAYERANFYKDLFVHDINNILSNIMSNVQLYPMFQQHPNKWKDPSILLNRIGEQGLKGKNLINNVEKLSKLEGAEVSLESIEVTNVLNKAINFIYHGFQDRKIKIDINVHDEEFYVQANELLFDVFENILRNAVRYTDNILVEIFVRISREQKESKKVLKIEFIDNGIGIPNNRKKIIFERGYKKEKKTRGMGFGLSLVKRIVESYNGEIRIEDKVKGDYTKGSNFILLIPEII